MFTKQKLLLPTKLLEALAAGEVERIIAAAKEQARRVNEHVGRDPHLAVRKFLKIRFAVSILAGFANVEQPLQAPPPAIDERAPVRKPKRAPAPASLLTHIARMGGIAWSEVLDLTGEAKSIIRPGLFRKSGNPLDDLATRLRCDGFDIPEDSADGGVQALRDMIRDELDGRRRHYSFYVLESAMEQEHHARQLADAERELEQP